MLTSYLAMQNAVLARNMAVSGMMNSSDRMMSSISFGNSQPLRPSFGESVSGELQIKSNETKVTVLQELIDGLNEALGKKIKNSTPKYAGLDYKA